MEALVVARHIEKIILALVEEGKKSTKLIEKKAQSAKDYDEAIGIRIGTLKASGVPVTVIKEQAKKDSADVLYNKILAEEFLKAHYCRIDILKAQLNGYQSIYKHLAET